MNTIQPNSPAAPVSPTRALTQREPLGDLLAYFYELARRRLLS